MSIAVRFVSGSLIDREFSFPKEFVRIGDAEGVDLRVDPAQPGDGGARGRVIEISVEDAGLRVRSAGDRELSAQGEFPLDHLVADGAEVRFGAWGPVFTVRHFPSEASRTAPVAVFDDSASRRPDDSASRRRARGLRFEEGPERPDRLRREADRPEDRHDHDPGRPFEGPGAGGRRVRREGDRLRPRNRLRHDPERDAIPEDRPRS